VRLPDGTSRTLTLTRQRGQAALYRATATTRRGGLEAGWIALADGTQRGAITQFITADPQGSARQTGTSAAPPLDTATGTVKWAIPGAGTVNAAQVSQPGVIDIDLDR
jgi:hypothetical protein